jgi:hypothetical protein
MADINLIPPNLDQKKLATAVLIVVAFLIFVLSLSFIVPILGVVAAVAIIGFAVYGIKKYFGL